MDCTKICLFSYNSRGFSQEKQEFCNFLMKLSGNKLGILCNQENFLFKANSYKINQCLPDSHIIFKPCLKEQNLGRPRNGMFIAVPNIIKENICDVSPPHWRIQAIIIKTIKSDILVISTYFPQDPKTLNFDETELIETLNAIDSVIQNNQFQNIILTGDINCDFLRRSGFVNNIDKYFDELNLKKSWEKFKIDFTHISELNGISHTSIIDHFFWNVELDICVEDAGVIYSVENQSDHEPVFCIINTGGLESNITETKNTNIIKYN